MSDYVVTTCEEHGVKIVCDLPSQRIYIAIAKACSEAQFTDWRSHQIGHHVDGTDCWACCNRMQFGFPGQSVTDEVADRVATALILKFGIEAAWTEYQIKECVDRVPTGYDFKTRVLQSVMRQTGWVAARAVLN